jgi:hypothetical protein
MQNRIQKSKMNTYRNYRGKFEKPGDQSICNRRTQPGYGAYRQRIYQQHEYHYAGNQQGLFEHDNKAEKYRNFGQPDNIGQRVTQIMFEHYRDQCAKQPTQ